jgi:large subunit ribosomal protein L13
MSTAFVSVEAARESRKWWVIDAAGVPVGRIATEAANLIRGKHKPTFTPNVDGGDFVVVLNADKVELTGGKKETKIYRHHTGFIGSLKEIPGASDRQALCAICAVSLPTLGKIEALIKTP